MFPTDHQTLSSPTNKSKSKMQYSFPKSKRFSSNKKL